MDALRPYAGGDGNYPSSPPSYEDYKSNPPSMPVVQPRGDAEENDEEALNKLIEKCVKEVNSVNFMNVKLVEKKGWRGIFFMTKKYEVTGEGGRSLASVKTDPSSCNCCVNLLFCGCMKKPVTLNVKDEFGNNVFQFKMLTNCCGISPTMEIVTGDGKHIGKIVKQFGLRPTLKTYDCQGKDAFTLRGPWSAVFYRWSKMKFYVSCKNEAGNDVNIGVIQRLKSCASVRFQTLKENDLMTKLLLLASTVMIDQIYYKQGQNDKAVPYH